MATPPDFTAGSVLTAAHMNAVGLWRITGCTVTSVGGTAATASNGVITIGNGNTSITVSSAFSSDFLNYKILFSGGGLSSATNIRMALGSSTTGYGDIVMYAGSTTLTTPQSTGTNNTATQWSRIGAGDADGLFVNIDVINPQITKHTAFSGPYVFPGSTWFMGTVAGIHRVTTAYTAFTITPETGSFTGGTIRVYGYRN